MKLFKNNKKRLGFKEIYLENKEEDYEEDLIVEREFSINDAIVTVMIMIAVIIVILCICN